LEDKRMINIEMCPAFGPNGGYYLAVGHAGKGNEAICNAVTAMEECLAANLDGIGNLRVRRTATDGHYDLRWNKSDRRGSGLHRANTAAGVIYAGLAALAKAYPNLVSVEWRRPAGREEQL
jgi:uncharacterized protein YsxB (DUF464 family)